MKTSSNSFSKMAATIVVLAAGITPAMADSLTINRVSGYYDTSFDGGEFSISGVTGAAASAVGYYDSKAVANGGFETFCLEMNQFISVPGNYNYAESSSAISGGVSTGSTGFTSGGISHDPISLGTAWLYLQFASGTLAGYNYTPGSARGNSAEELQMAIWWLENEISLTTNEQNSNPFLHLITLSTAQGGLGITDAVARSTDDGSTYAVGVINMGTSPNFTAQDQLVLTAPRTPHSVPDGATTVMLLGAVFGGVSILKRKSAKV
jgi:hypothetical protein